MEKDLMWKFLFCPLRSFLCFLFLFFWGVVCDPQWGDAVLMGPWQCDKFNIMISDVFDTWSETFLTPVALNVILL